MTVVSNYLVHLLLYPSFSFFTMRRGRPCSPLFPYTTLFRSGFTLLLSVLAGVLAGLIPSVRFTRTDVNEALKQGQSRDRKSTRLNSSHRCMSYAVFCLKKKN